MRADLALDRGHEILLPFGITAAFTSLWAELLVTEIRVGINGTDPSIVAPLALDKIENETHTFVARIDSWILPFLNVYGIYGETWVDSSMGLTIPKPGPGPPTIVLPIRVNFNSPTYGAGSTLVVGYKSWFAGVDANYTRTDCNEFDSEIKKKTVSIRTGLQGRSEWLKKAVRIGTMYIDRRTRLEGTTLSGTVVDPIRFELDQKFADPWNFLFGAIWQPSLSWNVTVAGGGGPRQQVTAVVAYRYGTWGTGV